MRPGVRRRTGVYGEPLGRLPWCPGSRDFWRPIGYVPRSTLVWAALIPGDLPPGALPNARGRVESWSRFEPLLAAIFELCGSRRPSCTAGLAVLQEKLARLDGSVTEDASPGPPTLGPTVMTHVGRCFRGVSEGVSRGGPQRTLHPPGANATLMENARAGFTGPSARGAAPLGRCLSRDAGRR